MAKSSLGLPHIPEISQIELSKIYTLVRGAQCPHCANFIESNWPILKKYFMQMREELILNGKQGVKNKSERELADLKWATLVGFDEAIVVPEKIVEQLEAEIEKRNEVYEEQDLVQI